MDTFWDEFESYIHSYLPQWQYSKNSGEPEAAVLYAMAELALDSRDRLHRLPQKHEIEFLNGFPSDPQGPSPRYAYAALTSAQGMPVPSGSEFYLSGNGERVWRTVEDAQAESARLMAQALSSGSRGKLIPLPLPTPEEPVPLFDFRADGAQRQAVRFEHPDAFASHNGCRASLILSGAGPELTAFLCSGRKTAWSLVSRTGEAISVDPPKLSGQTLSFELPAMPEAETLLVQARPGTVPPRGGIGQALAATQRPDLSCAAAVADAGALAGDVWLPFGTTPEVWRTCCLSCPDALSLRGAWITVRFTCSIQVFEELLPGMERETEYKPIMRRLPPPPPAIQDVCAEAVSWEYWNGSGWLPIPGAQAYHGSFLPEEGRTVRIEARFRWPEDAAPCQVQGQNGCWLRWRIQAVRGSAWLPRRCHTPEIAGLRFSARLDPSPVRVEYCSGLEDAFLPLTDRRGDVFPPLGPEQDCWWLGFDRPPAGDVLRLYLALRERTTGGALAAWESTGPDALHGLVLRDGTEGLAHSGMLTLSGFRGLMSRRFGRLCWWLCLEDKSGRLSTGRRFPRLEGLNCGAVCMRSVDADSCAAGESMSPLRGGALRGTVLTDAFGGSAAETDGELLDRARNTRHHLDRAVSGQDVEELVCGRLRDVVRTRCVLSEGVVTVGVLLRDTAHHAESFALRRSDILRLLKETGALPALGLRLQVREPAFYPVNVTAWIRPEPGVPFEDLRRTARDALERFLHPVTGQIHKEGWRLGNLPSEQEVHSLLQAVLPGGAVMKLLLTTTTSGGRELDCAQVRDPFALPLSGTHSIRNIQGRD